VNDIHNYRALQENTGEHFTIISVHLCGKLTKIFINLTKKEKVFFWGEGGRQVGHGVDHPPHLVLRLKKEYNCTCTPLLGCHGLL